MAAVRSSSSLFVSFVLCALLALASSACGDDDEPGPADTGPDATQPDATPDAGPSGIEAYFPEIPEGSGGPQVARALELTTANFDAERIDGPGATGLPGDVLMANDRLRVVIESANRAIGPCPWGGNIVDVDMVRDESDPFYDPDGDASDGTGYDELGEMSLLLGFGRTFLPDGPPEIVRDGSDGGAAVVRVLGTDTLNDYVNIRSLFGSIIPSELDAELDHEMRLAVTYVLAPGAEYVDVHWSVLASGSEPVLTSLGFLNHSGMSIEPFIPGLGWGAVGVRDIISGNPPAAPWAGGQGEGSAWAAGAMEPRPLGALVVLGVAFGIVDSNGVGELFGSGGRSVDLQPGQGTRIGLRLALGRDVGAAGAIMSRAAGREVSLVTGRVVRGGDPVAGARIGVVIDRDEDGTMDDGEPAVSAATTGPDGSFSAPVEPGRHFVLVGGEGIPTPEPVRADAIGDETIDLGAIEIAPAAMLALTITDADGALIPGKASLVGPRAERADKRIREQENATPTHGIAHAAFFAPGAPRPYLSAENPWVVPAGTYRLVVSRGPEWSAFDELVTLVAGETTSVTARLVRVVDTTGYVATDFHVHHQQSVDSAVSPVTRVMAALAEGTEMMTSSDHDVIFDYAPVVSELGYDRWLATTVGVESTPWDYGHFNAWPLPIDPMSPNRGAPDWGGGESFNLTPPELFEALRALGAQVVQVNHARAVPGGSTFQQAFDRAGLSFDFEARTFGGDPDLQIAPSDAMRLPPGATLFAPEFDAIELLNAHGRSDADMDGEPEDIRNEPNIRDWFNFLSFGFLPTAVGNSDTHSVYIDPTGGTRSYVRVSDDGEGAISGGAVAGEVTRTVAGRDRARDVIATNGPFVTVTVGDETESAIGRVVPAESGRVRVTVRAFVPSWTSLDTIELFANQTFESPVAEVADVPMRPVACATTRTPMAGSRCAAPVVASLGSLPLDVSTTSVDPDGAGLVTATATFDLALADLPNRGTTGDTWIVVRVLGVDATLWPVYPGLVDGSVDPTELRDRGVPAGQGPFPYAITNPVLVDADGDGAFSAPFAP